MTDRTEKGEPIPDLAYQDRAHLQRLYNLYGRGRVLGWLRGKVAVPLLCKDNEEFNEDEYYERLVDHYVETDNSNSSRKRGDHNE